MTQPEATVLIGSLIGLIIVGLGLTTAGFVFQRSWLLIAAMLGWLGMTFLGFLNRLDWNMATLFIWLGIGLALLCILSSIWMAYRARPEPEVQLPPDEQYENQLDDIRAEIRQQSEKRKERVRQAHIHKQNQRQSRRSQ